MSVLVIVFQDFINAIRKDWYDGIQTLGETVVFEPSQVKSATDNVGTYDRNNPDIRYQKTNVLSNWKNNVTNGVRFQLAEWSPVNKISRYKEREILWDRRNLENVATQEWISFTQRSWGMVIDDALNTLEEINKQKKNTNAENRIKRSKARLIENINEAIDDWYWGERHYAWFHDPEEISVPVIIYWKWDDITEAVRQKQEISFHLPTYASNSVPTWRLPISPVRLRKWGRL